MKKTLFSKPYLERAHHSGIGIHKLYRFDNGFGASVVRFKLRDLYPFRNGYGSYTLDESEWELAVIKWIENNFYLTYETPITNDVIGYLSENKVEKILQKIKKLKPLDKNLKNQQ